MTNDKYHYIIENGEVRSYAKNSENIIWSGKPNGIEVVSFAKIPESNDCVILLDWMSSSRLQVKNVLRITPLGEVVWEVNLPDKYKNILEINRQDDIYIGIYKISSLSVSINSYFGFLDSVDIKTGEVVASVFVK